MKRRSSPDHIHKDCTKTAAENVVAESGVATTLTKHEVRDQRSLETLKEIEIHTIEKNEIHTIEENERNRDEIVIIRFTCNVPTRRSSPSDETLLHTSITTAFFHFVIQNS